MHATISSVTAECIKVEAKFYKLYMVNYFVKKAQQHMNKCKLQQHHDKMHLSSKLKVRPLGNTYTSTRASSGNKEIAANISQDNMFQVKTISVLYSDKYTRKRTHTSNQIMCKKTDCFQSQWRSVSLAL